MSNKYYMNWEEISFLLGKMVDEMSTHIPSTSESGIVKVYGVPRGGAVIAGMLNARKVTIAGKKCHILAVDTLEECDVVVDDLYDSGATADKIMKELALSSKSTVAMMVLVDKRETQYNGQWIVFPWEESAETDIKDHVTRILEYIGEDVNRDGLKDTPSRVVKSWSEIYGGYSVDTKALLSTAFENDGSYDEMVLLKDIAFHSMCEHHMLPFIGVAHVAYIPKADGKVVGISKLARLVEAYAQRLQIQEKMTKDIAKDIEESLNAEGVAVVITAQHLCMKMRGVKNTTSSMTTSSLSGAFRHPETRAEFMALIK